MLDATPSDTNSPTPTYARRLEVVAVVILPFAAVGALVAVGQRPVLLKARLAVGLTSPRMAPLRSLLVAGVGLPWRQEGLAKWRPKRRRSPDSPSVTARP